MVDEYRGADNTHDTILCIYTVFATFHGILAHIPGTDDRHLEYSIICIAAIVYYVIIAHIY